MLRQCEEEEHWACFVHDRQDGSTRLQLLEDVDLCCRAERGGFFHKSVFDCFSLCQQPIASFTYLTPRAKQRFCPAAPLSSSSFQPQRLLSCCLYKNTSLPPSSHCQYVYGLLHNLQLFPQLWPGWTLRIYYDNSLILPALPPADEKDHDGSVSASSSAAVDCSRYTADVALAWSLLVSSLSRCRHVQFVYYNWPYLQDSSLHHHGHAGMMSRFLALAELGVTASHVAIVDLDNVWKAEGRRQAERDWQQGRLYHRYRDGAYNFELMGGGFNARCDTLNPRDPDASPFADIEAAIHSFLTRHHRRPGEVSASYGQMIDEAQDSLHHFRSLSERKRRAEPPADRHSRASRRARRGDAAQRAELDAQPGTRAEAEERDVEQAEPDAHDEQQAIPLSGSGSNCGLSLFGSDSLKLCEAEHQQQQQSASTWTPRFPPTRHYFGYALDQIFLLEAVWPVVRHSLETTAIRLPLISEKLRQLKRGQEHSAPGGRDVSAAPPLFSHFFGQVDGRLFPKPAEVLPWVQQQVRLVVAAWRQQGARMGRTDMQWLYDFASPGHFTASAGGEEEQRVRQRWEAFIGPPSTTSPRDVADRWRAEEEGERKAAAPHAKPAAAAGAVVSAKPLMRALTFSQADQPH